MSDHALAHQGICQIAAVAQAALDAGVTISALDPRAFMAKRSDPLPVDEALWRSFVEASHHNLRELAMATGGLARCDR